MARSVAVVWFQKDLRLDDNPALHTAAKRGGVIPVYIWSPETEDRWPPGAASRWWLHHSLAALAKNLERLGSRLVIARGDPPSALASIATEANAEIVYWNRCYEPRAADPQTRVAGVLTAAGICAEGLDGSVLFSPDVIRTAQGGPFKVFTPFWKACLALPSPLSPRPAPKELTPPDSWPSSLELDALGLLPRVDWATGIREAWEPGEEGALAVFEEFLSGALSSYTEARNRPDVGGTSRLSPYLHFGEISPLRIWHATHRGATGDDKGGARQGADEFLRQLGWREFAHHLLHHFPETTESPLRPEFSRFAWRDDARGLEAWQRGRTGFPFVDAGMRELWTTGWMHNRVRMVAASFLVKDLLIHWIEGAKWFWDTLVDADLANNTLGWQWTAGCGADAAPFFRIFNPMTQGEKFDPDGTYVRQWIPELRAIPARWIHRPWEAPEKVLADAGVELGRTYPRPVVDHFFARDRALAALAAIQKKP